MLHTLVLGASTKPHRYSFKAIERLRSYGHPVSAISRKEGRVVDVDFQIGEPKLEDVHTVTIYIAERHQAEEIDYILSLAPKRIIFNPGAENSAFYAQAKKEGIEVLEACTLVLLSTGQF
jgi:predicted CoA-binding protein